MSTIFWSRSWRPRAGRRTRRSRSRHSRRRARRPRARGSMREILVTTLDAGDADVFPAPSWRDGRRSQHRAGHRHPGRRGAALPDLRRRRDLPAAVRLGGGVHRLQRLAGRRRRHHRPLRRPGHRPRERGRRAGAEPAQRPQPQLLLRQVHLPRRDPDRAPRPARRHAVAGRARQRALRGRRRVEPARDELVGARRQVRGGPGGRSARTCSAGASRPCPRCPSGGSAPARRRRSP